MRHVAGLATVVAHIIAAHVCGRGRTKSDVRDDGLRGDEIDRITDAARDHIVGGVDGVERQHEPPALHSRNVAEPHFPALDRR
jgi:hypothetical protein